MQSDRYGRFGTIRCGFINLFAALFGGIVSLVAGTLSSPALSSHLTYSNQQPAAVAAADTQTTTPHFADLASTQGLTPSQSATTTNTGGVRRTAISPPIYATRANLDQLAAALIAAVAAEGREAGREDFANSAAYQSLEKAVADNARSVGFISNGTQILTMGDMPDLSGRYLSTNGGTISGTLQVASLIATTTSYATLSVTSSTQTNATSTTLYASTFAANTAAFGGTATSTFGSDGALILNGTFSANANTTLSNATSTNFFSTTASSTNLFAQTGALGSLSLSSPLGVASGGTGTTNVGQGWIYSSGGTSALAASSSPTVNYITATSTAATSTFGYNLYFPNQQTGIAFGSGAILDTTYQPANAVADLIARNDTYHDNVLTLENDSVQLSSGQCGNDAIRFRDSIGHTERAAFGYSSVQTGCVTGYSPDYLYAEVGNIGPAGNTDDTSFAVINTHAGGENNFPATSYKMLDVRGDTGNIYINNSSSTRKFYFDNSSGGLILNSTSAPKSQLDVNGNLAIGSYAGSVAAPSNGLIVSGNVGLGTSTPGVAFDVSSGNNAHAAYIRAADVNQGGGASGQLGVIEAITNRGDGNFTFEGRLAAGRLETNGTAIATSSAVGGVLFGGQWGTNANFTSSQFLYPASIKGVADGSYVSAAAMPTALTFSTGSAGDSITSVNVSYGTERMRITSVGLIGINTATPKSQLDVNGGVAIGSYAGNNAAPSNSLIISGSIAVGASTVPNGTTAQFVGAGAIHADCNGANSVTGGPIISAECNTNNSGIRYTYGGNGAVVMSYNPTDGGVYTTDGSKLSFKIGSANPTLGTTAMLLTSTTASIGTSTPNSRLEVWGPDTASTSAFAVVNNASTTVFSVYDNGNATYSGSIFQSSDQRLKTNVSSLDAPASLSEIEQLNPVSYLRVDEPNNGTNLGFLAQQVALLFPELVSTTSATGFTPDGTLTLNYEGLLAPIVGAIKGIASVSGDFERNLIVWLGSAGNGIHDLYASVVHSNEEDTQKLCTLRSDGAKVCLSGDQLANFLAGQGGELLTAPGAVASASRNAVSTSSGTTDDRTDQSADATSTEVLSAPSAVDAAGLTNVTTSTPNIGD